MIAKIGDMVLYTKNAPLDNPRYHQMKKYLVKGFWYTIKNIYFRSFGYKYEFEEMSTGSYSYPSECFISNYKKYMENKYNLK